MQEYNLFDAKTHFSSIIAQIIDQQEEVLIKKRGQIVAKIIPYQTEKKIDVRSAFKALNNLAKELGHTDITAKEIRKMREEGRS